MRWRQIGWLLLVAACSDTRPKEARLHLPGPEEVRADLESLPFDSFVERSYTLLLQRSPELVVELHLADHIPIGRTFLDDVSDDFRAETQAIERVLLELIQNIDRS